MKTDVLDMALKDYIQNPRGRITIQLDEQNIIVYRDSCCYSINAMNAKDLIVPMLTAISEIAQGAKHSQITIDGITRYF